jgi:regulatory protein
MNKKLRRPIKVPTAGSLLNSATYYLSRYAASEQSLRRVLQNKIRRASVQNPAFAQDVTAKDGLNSAIERIIEQHRKSGVLNDQAFAEVKTRSLRRAGRSRRAIQQTLGMKGLKADVIAGALVKNDAEDEDSEGGSRAELKAATALARKRRFGPFRTGEANPDRQRKDLAAMARAGFSLDTARKVLGGKEDIDFD